MLPPSGGVLIPCSLPLSQLWAERSVTTVKLMTRGRLESLPHRWRSFINHVTAHEKFRIPKKTSSLGNRSRFFDKDVANSEFASRFDFMQMSTDVFFVDQIPAGALPLNYPYAMYHHK